MEIKGCFFHLSSKMWKHIQSDGLLERHSEDLQFAVYLHMLAALAFVLENNVNKYFNKLCDRIQQVYVYNCEEVLVYFENQYIGRFWRNAPRTPQLFSLDIWNMFYRTQYELPQTNYYVGWHGAFQASISVCNPTIYRFMNVL